MRSRRGVSTLGKITTSQEAQVRLEADVVRQQLTAMRIALNRALRSGSDTTELQVVDSDLRGLEGELSEVYAMLTVADQTTYVVLSTMVSNLQESVALLAPSINAVGASSLERAKELRVVGAVVAVGGAIFVGWLLARGRR